LKRQKAQKKPCRIAGSNMYDYALREFRRSKELLAYFGIDIGARWRADDRMQAYLARRVRSIRRNEDRQATAPEAIS